MDIKKFMSGVFTVLDEHKPEIMLTLGVGGMVAGAVVACKNTLKLPEVNDEITIKATEIKTTKELLNYDISEENHKLIKKDLKERKFNLYTYTAKEYAKLYGVPTLLMGSSIVLIFSSNNIMRKRLATMTASYLSVASMFDEYRQRVKTKYGEEAERKIATGEYTGEIEEATLDKNGKEIIKKKKGAIVGMSSNPHIFYFNEVTSSSWSNSMSQNYMFLKAQKFQSDWKLQSNECYGRQALYLNDVLKELGFKHDVPFAQFTGWTFAKGGEDFVDFGCFEYDDRNDPCGIKPECIKYVKYPNIEKPIKSIVLTFNDEGTKAYERATEIYMDEVELRGEIINEEIN